MREEDKTIFEKEPPKLEDIKGDLEKLFPKADGVHTDPVGESKYINKMLNEVQGMLLMHTGEKYDNLVEVRAFLKEKEEDLEEELTHEKAA